MFIKRVLLLQSQECDMPQLITSVANQFLTMQYVHRKGSTIPTHTTVKVGAATIKITYSNTFEGVKTYTQTQYCSLTIGDDALNMNVEHFLVEFLSNFSPALRKHQRISEAVRYLKEKMIISPKYNHVVRGDLNEVLAELMA